jgi:hypothetical protein
MRTRILEVGWNIEQEKAEYWDRTKQYFTGI